MEEKMKEVNTNVIDNSTMGAASLEKVLITGDLSSLSSHERTVYYTTLCKSLALNPLTKPFDYITLNGKLTLYAKRDCTEQLRKINSVSIAISSREVSEDCYIVTAKATDGTGRTDESIGAVSISNLKGEARSNAMMKAETKAKRRVTLSICGMGMLDEVEVSSIPLSMIEIPNEDARKLEVTLSHKLKTLCVTNGISAREFAKFHKIEGDKPETVKYGVDNFALLKEQFETFRKEQFVEVENENTH
jgi:hypothetical protein